MKDKRKRFGIENAYHTKVGESVDLSGYVPDIGDSPVLTVESWSTDVAKRNDDTNSVVTGRITDDGATFIADSPGLYRVRANRADGPGPSKHGMYIIADPPTDIRMYTMIPRVCGPIAQWKTHLDRIEMMGFNAVQLLPITETGPSLSPYAISDHFAIDPSFGNCDPSALIDEFDAFIDACNRRSIRVCVDLVLNHVAVEGKAAREHPEWLAEDPVEPDGIRRAGWSDGTTWNVWSDLALLDFAPFDDSCRVAMETYLDRYALFWAERAAATCGIVRLDNLHSSNGAYMSRLLRLLRQKFPQVLILGELFGDERLILKTANSMGVNLLLGTPWEHKFVPELRSYLQYVHRMHDRLHFHFPVSSHDSGTVVEEFGSPLATPPRLVASMLLGSGSTGIVQGIEHGAEKKIEFIGRATGYTRLNNTDFCELLGTLNRLHAEEPLFQRAGNVIFVDNHHVAIIAAVRIDPQSGTPRFLVCANFDTSQPQTIILPPMPGEGVEMRDELTEETLTWEGDQVKLTFEPGGIGVYRLTTKSSGFQPNG